MTIRIAVRGTHAAAQQRILRNARNLGVTTLQGCRITNLYFLSEEDRGVNSSAGEFSTEAINRLCAFLLVDPVLEQAEWSRIATTSHTTTSGNEHVIEVALLPGVTDVAARELMRGMSELGLPRCAATTATRYELAGNLSAGDLHTLATKLLCNETIEEYRLSAIQPHFDGDASAINAVETIPLRTLPDDALLALSRNRLLSLDTAEMRAIQEFYQEIDRDPTDVELETLAQTWSEHCVHKTFRAQIEYTERAADGTIVKRETLDGLLNQFIRAATEKIAPSWLYSAFVDDAGIIKFDDEFDLAFKVETHNHPSALEPFGGANTGIGGVVRDILGVSARPIACTDVLCFGPQGFPHEQLPDGLLHPQRIQEGVVAGIGDYGNKLGLPTVNGAVFYDTGYLGNPLVFCGCVGLLPHNSHPTQAQVNDLIVALGGRTGRDGIHGATFSSAELTHDTAATTGSAVQIGDPITEKGLIEVVEVARDERLYHAITDCGAGGFSSAIGEMGEELGVAVELTKVPLKYPGLIPWEIWLSEAQERLVVAVPPEKLARFQELAQLWDVELSVLGQFTGDKQLVVCYEDNVVADLPMRFLHDGLPRRTMRAEYRQGEGETRRGGNEERGKRGHQSPVSNLNRLVLDLLSHPSIASKEEIVRTYDHEVRGGTLVRPFVGPEMDGPADAAVLKPLGTWHHDRAFALSVGINPLLGKRDPYAMAISAVDEAVRNLVAVGSDPERVAILDNFCWGNPTLSDRLGALVQAARGCHDAAVAYGTPFISGKDSLYNEFNGEPIPGTLLISAIGIVPEMRRVVTSNLKTAGNWLYLLGETKGELGGSLLYHLEGNTGGVAPAMPDEPLARYRQVHRAILDGLVCACHDLSEGGLAVAIAEMCIAGRLGARIDINVAQLSPTETLFSESNGRLLLEIAPDDATRLEAQFADLPLTRIGQVTSEPGLIINDWIDLPVDDLVSAWKREGGQA